MVNATDACVTAIVRGHPEYVASVLERYSADVVVDFISRRDIDEAALVVGWMMPTTAASTLVQFGFVRAAELIAQLKPEHAAAIIRAMDGEHRTSILEAMDQSRANLLRNLVEASPNTAAVLLYANVLVVQSDSSVSQVLEAARTGTYELPDYAFAVRRPSTFEAMLAISTLLRSDGDASIRSVEERRSMAVTADTPVPAVLSHPIWRTSHALPVVDKSGQLLGAIPHTRIHEVEAARRAAPDPAVSTALTVGELYWFGLTGVIDGLARRSRSGANTDEGARDAS